MLLTVTLDDTELREAIRRYVDQRAIEGTTALVVKATGTVHLIAASDRLGVLQVSAHVEVDVVDAVQPAEAGASSAESNRKRRGK